MYPLAPLPLKMLGFLMRFSGTWAAGSGASALVGAIAFTGNGLDALKNILNLTTPGVISETAVGLFRTLHEQPEKSAVGALAGAAAFSISSLLMNRRPSAVAEAEAVAAEAWRRYDDEKDKHNFAIIAGASMAAGAFFASGVYEFYTLKIPDAAKSFLTNPAILAVPVITVALAPFFLAVNRSINRHRYEGGTPTGQILADYDFSPLMRLLHAAEGAVISFILETVKHWPHGIFNGLTGHYQGNATGNGPDEGRKLGK